MPLTSVIARAIRIPVSRPTRMSTRDLNQRDYLLVEVRSSDTDEVGIGYAYTGTSGGPMVADAVTDMLAPLLVGRDSDAIVSHWERMYQETLLVGRRGGVLRAMSAVDLALWDLSAKRRKTPLAVLLGGGLAPIPAYASGGYYRSDDGPWVEAVTKEIQFNASLGFRDHKIKVGGLPIAQDALRVEAAVAAAGPDGRVALDANNAYRNVPDALKALRSFEAAAGSQGLWWFEEPMAADDIEGHAELNRRSDTTIATGEIHQTRWDFQALLDRRACGLLQPDVAVIGGVTEYMRVAHAAELAGVPTAPHWHANAHVHVAAATPGCIAVEHFALEKDIYNFEMLLDPASRLVVRDGHAELSELPGLGIVIDEAAVQKYELTR
ncbi:MAG: mandelate racemase/muconate lactonizing protein [Marmoricola sp.]|jgi:L-alanine-DL-glutamate epimerase-like enolase superfamily enzyme|nr:mandelate racemase/muconate lactonizing protein [Marmoricola sp.]